MAGRHYPLKMLCLSICVKLPCNIETVETANDLTCYRWLALDHGLINYKDTKVKCCHLKNWPVKRLCGRCLSVSNRLEIQSVMLLFSTKLCMGLGPQTDKHLTQRPLMSQFFYMTTFCIAFCESYLSKHYIDFILKLLWRILGSRHWRICPHTFHDLNTLLAPLLVQYSMY